MRTIGLVGAVPSLIAFVAAQDECEENSRRGAAPPDGSTGDRWPDGGASGPPRWSTATLAARPAAGYHNGMSQIRLIPFRRDQFPILSGWFKSETQVVQWGGDGVRYPLDDDQMDAMLRLGKSDPPSKLCWSACLGDRIVGHAQCDFDWRNGNAKLARIGIAPEAREQGHGKAMLSQVVEQAFAFPAIERIELNVFAWNATAIRAYEGVGFRLEGVRRESVRVGGERWDTAIMAMLRSERAR